MISSRFLRIGGIVIVGIVIVAALDTIKGGSTTAGLSREDILSLAESKIKMVGDSDSDETPDKPLDGAMVAFNAKVTKAYDLTIVDVEALICARAGQYLDSAAESSQKGMDEGAWLREQLRLENQLIKEALSTHASLSGRSHHMAAAAMPLLNRSAIMKAIQALQAGDVSTCRVTPYDSAIAIDDVLISGDAMRQNQKNWATPTESEVAAND